jgi:hypothetical protein
MVCSEIACQISEAPILCCGNSRQLVLALGAKRISFSLENVRIRCKERRKKAVDDL